MAHLTPVRTGPQSTLPEPSGTLLILVLMVASEEAAFIKAISATELM